MPDKLSQEQKNAILVQVFQLESDEALDGLPDVLEDTGDWAERRPERQRAEPEPPQTHV